MKTINIEEDIHSHLLKNTVEFGESPSSVLRRLLGFEDSKKFAEEVQLGKNLVGTDAPSEIEIHLKSLEFRYSKGAVGRFLSILGLVYKKHASVFQKVENIKGRGRLYFSRNVQVLNEAGRNVNPKQIPGSPYWVITTTPTDLKREIITVVMKTFDYSGADIRAVSTAIAG